MNIIKSFSLFLLFSVFACCGISSASQLSSELRGDFFQGSVIFASVKGASASAEAFAELDGRIFSLSNINGVLMGGISLPLDAAEGSYRIVFTVSDGGTKSSFERSVNIKPKAYGTQHLRITESQLASYDDPQSDIDNDAILDALKKCSDNIRWEKSFIRPVDGRVSTLFGLKRFYNDDPEPEFHKGVDIAGYTGKKIVAPQNGIVLMAKNDLLLHGGTVVISHGRGIGTIYLHLDSVAVSEGQHVRQGEVIGFMGEKGVSTAPHLHWAAYAGGYPINPWLLMNLPASWLGK